MSPHPVQLDIEAPARMDRLQLLIRVALLVALGAVGCSSVYWLMYLALPAIAALLISQKGAERYVSEDGTWMVRILRWLAGAYAYLWLLTDTFPTSEATGSVVLRVEPGGLATAGSALLRLLTSLPALLALAVLSLAASVLWVVGAVTILFSRRVPTAIADFLALTLRYQFRLFAYHLSIVDQYPSVEVPARSLPRSVV